MPRRTRRSPELFGFMCGDARCMFGVGMRVLYLRPAPPLDRFVEVLWYHRGEPQAHAFERLLPMGTPELVVNLGQDRNYVYDVDDPRRVETRDPAVVVGAHSTHFLLDTACQQHVVGVHFRPGGAYPFLLPPADELRNAQVSLGDLWGSAAVSLRDRLLEEPTPEAKLAALADALLAHMVRPLEGHPAVRYALAALDRAPRVTSIARLTDRVGLSARRFADVFSAEVGLTPKVYCRVRRFQEVIRRARGERGVEWARVALDCGYYDQAHFIKDFRAFSGLSPSAYLACRTEHLNHVPIPD